MAAKEKVEATKEQKLVENISSFVTKNKKWFVIGLIALVVILLAIIITTASVSKSREKAFIRIEQLEEQLEVISESEDTNAIDEYVASLEKEIKGSSYSSVKASYILGEFYAAKENWSKAYDYFMKAHDLNSKIYLANVSLFNAAVATEEQGNTNKALELYTSVSEDLESPMAAKALFNVARIYYQSGNKELAEVTFQQLIDNFEYSEYSLIAADIISLM